MCIQIDDTYVNGHPYRIEKREAVCVFFFVTLNKIFILKILNVYIFKII